MLIATSPQAKPDSSAISDKIVEIRENKISRYEPLIKPEGGLTYTGFSDHDFARQLDILKSLKRLGIVKEEPFDYIRKCNKCDHHGVVVKVACPACGSTNTDQGKVIEHLTCGNTDIESKFQAADGGLSCPKCKKRLKAIGVDYVKPGSYCACLSCKTLSPTGKMQFVCLNCGSSLAGEEMKLEPLAAYVVDQEAVTKYLERTGVQFDLAIAEALRGRGIKAAPKAVIIGSSQIEHTFDIVGYSSEHLSPSLVIEIDRSGELVDQEMILNFLARCLDARVERKVFVGVPGFSEQAKKLAAAHGIELIESDGSNAAEIADRIARDMPQAPASDQQLVQMIESTGDAMRKDGGQPDPERDSLEVMIRTLISRPTDADKEEDAR